MRRGAACARDGDAQQQAGEATEGAPTGEADGDFGHAGEVENLQVGGARRRLAVAAPFDDFVGEQVGGVPLREVRVGEQFGGGADQQAVGADVQVAGAGGGRESGPMLQRHGFDEFADDRLDAGTPFRSIGVFKGNAEGGRAATEGRIGQRLHAEIAFAHLLDHFIQRAAGALLRVELQRGLLNDFREAVAAENRPEHLRHVLGGDLHVFRGSWVGADQP